ncbi:hypothetical protein BZG36_00850 [Bifiguratus adelaidae]|uniref:Phosphatidylinositol transfer protein N-terminal domain-containing protein n=1 Tax=Bifiguratus adelaidae TaxID=1938954 RepID=A0A261Y6H5_9FUNG|nr:hypothetical protein BZG36_00850 [Bifiguratus adelaidae]
MLIKEYRIINNCTESEYQVAQLYAVAMASQQETGGGEGVEVLKNEPYEKENGEKGQYTYKVYHLASRMPSFVKAIAPTGSLDLYEEAWNAYPYCKTVLTNGWMKENFSLVYETLHVDQSRGELENALNLPADQLAKREVVMMDIANDKLDSPKDYIPEEDPTTYHSEKSGRGPLNTPDWKKTCEPVMTCYKVTFIEFKWFGLQSKVESFIARTVRNMLQKFHRQLFCWTDRWYGMTMDDIRKLEEQTKLDLDKARAMGEKKGEATD